MALTGAPLLVLSFVATLAAAALTVRFWRRGGRSRVLTRAGCVLLCEALALFTAGVAVNDYFDGLYPSWSTLFQPDATPSTPAAIAAGPDTQLDLWLKGHVADAAELGLVFDWQPRELAAWRLPAAPIVYVPPAYFTQADLRFPVVMVIAPSKAGPGQAGWDQATVAALVATSSADPVPAILVFLRVDQAGSAGLIEQDLPAQLDADLRVNGRGWAVVGVGTDAALALSVLAGAPLRYRSTILVAGGDGVLSNQVVLQAHHLPVDQAALLIVGAPATTGPGGSTGGQGGGDQVTDAPSGPPDLTGSGVVNLESVTQPAQRLAVALRWAYQQLPAPLRAASPAPLPSGRR